MAPARAERLNRRMSNGLLLSPLPMQWQGYVIRMMEEHLEQYLIV